MALGALWLIDGGLQFQPYMFTKGFMAGILGMANMGLPGWLSSADYHVARLLVTHFVVWNAAFASLQVAIGFGLIWGRRRTKDVARGVSIVWAVGVWTVGEGVGGVLMGGTSLLTGAPGAALLYAIVAVVVWPPRIRVGLARAAWVAVWAGSALLELQSINHASSVPGAQIANGAAGEPGLVGAVDRSVGHALAGGGAGFASVLAAAAVFAGFGILGKSTRKAALITGMVVAGFVGLVGQDLGGILTGQGTDPGSGPLLVLMAILIWPGRLGRRRPASAPSDVKREPASGVGALVTVGSER